MKTLNRSLKLASLPIWMSSLSTGKAADCSASFALPFTQCAGCGICLDYDAAIWQQYDDDWGYLPCSVHAADVDDAIYRSCDKTFWRKTVVFGSGYHCNCVFNCNVSQHDAAVFRTGMVGIFLFGDSHDPFARCSLFKADTRKRYRRIQRRLFVQHQSGQYARIGAGRIFLQKIGEAAPFYAAAILLLVTAAFFPSLKEEIFPEQ